MTRTFGALLGLGMLLSPLACQAIAGVDDVEYTAQSSAALCDEYCANVMAACPGDVAVYDDYSSCTETCKALPAGNPEHPEGNTVACRNKQAKLAALTTEPIEKAAHCPAAGPGGSRTCTFHADLPDCEGYCAVYMSACRSISMKWGFGKFEECVQECAAIAPTGEYSIAAGKLLNDDLACRLNFATKAIDDPDANCASAGVRPAEQCLGAGPPSCKDYCRAVGVACTDVHEVYESRDQCLAVCDRTTLGKRTDNGLQDTVGCRVSHSYNALLIDPNLHCPHSGPAGDGVCSDMPHPNCEPYCKLAADACPEEFNRRFADDEACLSACEKLEDAEPGNGYSVGTAQGGDTLKCRTLNVARALEFPDRGGEFCPAAFGGAPCD